MAFKKSIPNSPLGWTVRVFLTVALVCFAWVGWVLADTALAGAWQERQLEKALADAPVEAPAYRSADGGTQAVEPVPPEWGELAEGDLVGRIEIEELGVSAVALFGVTPRTLRKSAGLIPGTSRPGEPGNVGLAGHRDSFFRGLSNTSVGNRITLTTPHGAFEYEVDSMKVVSPQDTHVLDAPDDSEMLTLVTCYPFYYVGPAPDRFIVHARRVDSPR